MDSMINRYTADRKIRSDDAYSPHGEGGKRPGPLFFSLCTTHP